MSRQVKVGAITVAVLISELQDGPRTAQDLADATGCHPATMRGYLRALKAKGCIFISGYEATRARTRLYCLGHRTDAPRLPRASRKEIWHERKKREALATLNRVRLAA